MNEFPARFGPYTLLRSLNEGGMGEVSLAMSGPPGLETLCVVKRILCEKRGDPAYVRRFRHEADIARRLVHGNIVQTHAVGEIGGEPFIAQEFVDGHDLQELLDRAASNKRPLPVAAAVQIARGVAAALAFAHDFEGLDLIHRDVTPGNIRITYAGEVKLLDFGVARSELAGDLTVPGQRWGKLAYMAPEQAQNRRLDRRSDLFTLGVVLWVMLSGHPVGTTLDGARPVPPPEDKQRLLEEILRCDPPPPSRLNPAVPVALDEVVARATAKVRERRFANAATFAAVLAPFAAVVPSGDTILAELLQDSFDAKAERSERADLVAAARRWLHDSEAHAPAVAVVAASAGEGKLRRKTATQATQRNRRAIPLAILGGLLVTGLLAYDLVHLSRGPGTPAPSKLPAATVASPLPQLRAPEVVATEEAAPAAPNTADAGTSAAEEGMAREAPEVVPSPPAQAEIPAAPTARPAPAPGEPAPHRPAALRATRALLLERAQAAFDQGNLDRAEIQAQRAAALGNPEADALLGAVAFKRGHLEQAERLFSKALRRDPNDARIARQLQMVRDERGAKR